MNSTMLHYKHNLKTGDNMQVTQEQQQLFIAFALRFLQSNMDDDIIETLMDYYPVEGLSYEEILELLEQTIQNQEVEQ